MISHKITYVPSLKEIIDQKSLTQFFMILVKYISKKMRLDQFYFGLLSYETPEILVFTSIVYTGRLSVPKGLQKNFAKNELPNLLRGSHYSN